MAHDTLTTPGGLLRRALSFSIGVMATAMISPAAAEAAIRARVPPLAAEPTPLAALSGTVLREQIVASRDQPPFDRVTMDGIAFASHSGRREFRIAGTQAAGARQMEIGRAHV